ncbi:MAG: hypothetical protein O3B21_09265 [Proteobacteria bacterium]|nr:hypothetical protein [Pseudomonadota bacterium]MDA1356587.1 hypothetical protein [Pseudomonadota bacterium]
MNFFEAQDRARRKTVLLVFLFALAVLALVVMTFLFVLLFVAFDHDAVHDGGSLFVRIGWQTYALVGAGVVAVVVLASVLKIVSLSAGGRTVAEDMSA